MLLHAGATEGGPKTVCGIEICPTRFHLSLQAIKKYALHHHQISFQIAVFEGSVLDITTFPKGLVYMFDIGMTEEIYAHLSLCMWWTTTVNHLVSYQTPAFLKKFGFPVELLSYCKVSMYMSQSKKTAYLYEIQNTNKAKAPGPDPQLRRPSSTLPYGEVPRSRENLLAWIDKKLESRGTLKSQRLRSTQPPGIQAF